MGLVLKVGSNFLLNLTLTTCPKPHLQKVLPCRRPCHALGLRTWDHVSSGKSQTPCSQWLKLHGLTSSDLGTHVNLPLEAIFQKLTYGPYTLHIHSRLKENVDNMT